MSTIVTRFAPSPTGHLHIGGARTAIFSWLLARSKGGKFLLRIEDTDRERSTQEMTQAILDSMQWLGLDWDGEPVFQSQRQDKHMACVEKLLETGHAYWCQCTPDEVEAMREKARAEGRKPKYDGHCRELGLGPGENRVVRFKTPLEGRTAYTDLVKGPVAVENTELDDMIILRSDGTPTYNLAVVADDSDMGVTLVLRGEDHISNTPRQILIYRALGLTPPEFGHVPLIHGQDKKKLSKRHGAKSVMEYKQAGLLPEAVLNYLVRLGWSHGDDEIFSRKELLEMFGTESLSKSPAAFDPDKLLWLNSHYIKESDPDHLAALLGENLAALNLPVQDADRLKAMLPLFQPRAQTMVEMAEMAAFLVTPDQDLAYDEKAVNKFLKPEAREHLTRLRGVLASLDPFDQEAMDAAFKQYIEDNEIMFKAIAQPLRVSLTGKTVSPGLYEVMEVLGKESSLARLDQALALPQE